MRFGDPRSFAMLQRMSLLTLVAKRFRLLATAAVGFHELIL